MTLRNMTLVATAVLLMTSAAVSAQIINAQVGGFGTQVKVGDADYTPLLKRVSAQPRAMEADVGITSQVSDNCIVLLNDFPATDLPGITFRQPSAAASGWNLQNKDVQLTPCQGKPAGNVIGDIDVTMKTFTWTERLVEVRYGDVNQNGKFDKGDVAYLVTVGNTGDPLATTANGLVASTGLGVWTVRLTPVTVGTTVYAAGSFVYANDLDFQQFGTIAAGPGTTTLATPKATKFSLEEREGGNYYLIPDQVNAQNVDLKNGAVNNADPYQFKQQMVPVNSIRIGTVNVFTLQPGVIPTDAALANPDAAQTGQDLPVLSTLLNNGATAGQGVIVTKLDGRIVDVRLSPVLSPGESTKILITVPGNQVVSGGTVKLNVNDVVAAITIKGSSLASAAGDLAALQARIAALEAKSVVTQKASSMGSPGFAPMALLAALGLAVVVLRRRAA